MARKRSDRPVPNELDPLIHERLRLGILSALAVEESISFTGLRDLLATTDGNLSVQARRLEEAGYVSCEKTFEGRKPRSTYRLAPRGRKALEEYLEVLSGLLPDISSVRRSRAPRPGTDPLPTHG
ncbi:MAG: transcriptional regulator [Acidobacteria bacterium]|jgi:DNA-binding MarR family transcriptional regulator|nr:transcriptional regulator [Acidobacteriota bacterium]